MELWSATRCTIYKAELFDSIIEILDNGKSAAIDDIWQILLHNLAEAYTPHGALRVFKQLFPYRGRTHYITSKPAKYGLIEFLSCEGNDILWETVKPTTGDKPRAQRCAGSCGKYLKSSRNIYADNFFTTLDLARVLLRRKTAYVGTVRYNKTFIPQEFKKNPKCTINSTLFWVQRRGYSIMLIRAGKKW